MQHHPLSRELRDLLLDALRERLAREETEYYRLQALERTLEVVRSRRRSRWRLGEFSHLIGLIGRGDIEVWTEDQD
jgi:hypothetical protein